MIDEKTNLDKNLSTNKTYVRVKNDQDEINNDYNKYNGINDYNDKEKISGKKDKNVPCLNDLDNNNYNEITIMSGNKREANGKKYDNFPVQNDQGKINDYNDKDGICENYNDKEEISKNEDDNFPTQIDSNETDT